MTNALAETSNIIAICSAVASGVCAYYARYQASIARWGASNDHRAQLSQHHQRYRELLADVRKQHREQLSRLSRIADVALKNVIEVFDCYDINRQATRPARHLIHEASEMVYCSFKGQMAWQYGRNLSHRMAAVVRFEDKLDPQEIRCGGSNFRRVLAAIYKNDPNAFLETELLNDKHFCSLVDELKSRTSSTRSGALLMEVNGCVAELRSMLKDLRSEFEESTRLINSSIEENVCEEYSLEQESPRLYKRLEFEKARLDILCHIWMPEVEEGSAGKYHNYISVSLAICTVLHAIQDVHSWGWGRESS
jgi:hypothetical protein